MSSKNAAEQVMTTIATGAGASTKITVTGMAVGDVVKAVHNLTDASAVALAGLVVSADGFLVTASTSGKSLLVHWIDRSAG